MKLIAETAWHHEGDSNFLINLINELNEKCEADYIKLHITLDIDEYMDHSHPSYSILKKMLIEKKKWEEAINLINIKSKPLLLLNDIKAVEFGMSFDPEIVEIHSVCLNDIHLLDSLRNNINKDTVVMFGIGGSSLYEIEKAIDRVGTERVILMHGFQNYPTKFEDINFNKIRKIMRLYPNFKHGYADHTGWNEPDNLLITLMGASLGMNYIEKHVTTAYGQNRIDSSAAINIEMFNELHKKLQLLSACNGNGLLEMNVGERKYSTFGQMKKAAKLKSDVIEGEILREEHLRFIRTGESSDLSQLEILNRIGSKFSKDICKSSVLQANDFIK